MRVLHLALLVLIGSMNVRLILAGFLFNPQEYYDAIDNYLTLAVSSNDVDKNMASAAKWLTELQKRRFSLRDKSLVKALKQVVKLKTVLGEDECNRKNYDILNKVYENAGYPQLTGVLGDDPAKRINHILRYYARRHSDACAGVWPQKLNQRMNEVAPESIKYVWNLAKVSKSPWDPTYRNMEYIRLLREYNETDYKHQKRSARKGNSYKMRMISRADYRKYMINPCKEVREKVSAELYEPIWFDITVQRRETEFLGYKHKRFRDTRRAMGWCEHILNNEAIIWETINAIMVKKV